MPDTTSDSSTSSSTEKELEQLKSKLAELAEEDAAKKEQLETYKPTSTFALSFSEDDSSISSVESLDVKEDEVASRYFQEPRNAPQQTESQETATIEHAPMEKHTSPSHRIVASDISPEAPVRLSPSPTKIVPVIQRAPPRNPYLSRSKTGAHKNAPPHPHPKEVNTSTFRAGTGLKTSDSSSSKTCSSSSASSSSSSDSSDEDDSSSSSSSTGSSSMDDSDVPMKSASLALVETPPKSQRVVPSNDPATQEAPERNPHATVVLPDKSNKAMKRQQESILDPEDYRLFFGDDEESESEVQTPHYSIPPLQLEVASGSKEITPSPSQAKKKVIPNPLKGNEIYPATWKTPVQESRPPDNSHETASQSDTLKISHSNGPGIQAAREQSQHTGTAATFSSVHDITKYQCPSGEFNQNAEIDRKLCVPPVYEPRRQPTLHRYHATNRPKHTRRQIPVSDLFQSPVSSIWSGKFDKFNALQSELAQRFCQTNDHMVVSAPTGAGKTALFEMAIARFITEDLSHSRNPSRLSKHRKMLYIAPSKALSEERYQDWTKRLPALHLGIRIAMITGESNDQGAWHQDLTSAHLILTTPEKWDSITRKWTDNFFLLASVKLILVDEVHLLGDDSRGPCLEAVLTRMKSIQRAASGVAASQEAVDRSSYPQTTASAIASPVRTVAVSATLPNIVDVAEFVGAQEAFTFDSSYRPVPLRVDVHACGFLGRNEFKFWESLDAQVPSIIRQCSDNKQTLIFCHTKNDTEKLCKTLIAQRIGNKTTITTSSMSGTVEYNLLHRVAFHHAGMPPEDKARVEEAFATGEIRCLCATSTLAVGVNLPAHLVIIKGTRAWRGSGQGYQDIDKQSLLQMIGRAGRPGLDTSGRAIIMTDNNSKSLVESRIQGLGPAESRILPKLKDALATEVALQVVPSMTAAVDWLKTTYLFVRMRQTPEKYAMNESWRTIDEYINHLLQVALENLAGAKLIEIKPSGEIYALPGCHIMSQRMISFESMRAIASLPYDATKCQILTVLAKMEEFSSHVFRKEKKELNECHGSACVKYNLEGPKNKVRVQEPWEKAFVLLQAFIGGHRFESFALRQQMTVFGDSAIRMLEAAEEYSSKGSLNGFVASQCKKLRRSLYFSLWGEDDGILQQVNGISHEIVGRLKMVGISTFDQVMKASDHEIEKASGRPNPFGLQVKTWVSTVLQSRLKVSASVTYTTGAKLATDVTCSLTFADPSEAILSSSKKTDFSYAMFAYTDQPGSCALFRDNISGPMIFTFTPPPRFGKLFISLVASIIGLDETIILDGNSPAQKSSFVDIPKRQGTNPTGRAMEEKVARKAMREVRHPSQTIRSLLQDQFRQQQANKSNDKRDLRKTTPVTHVEQNSASVAQPRQETLKYQQPEQIGVLRKQLFHSQMTDSIPGQMSPTATRYAASPIFAQQVALQPKRLKQQEPNPYSHQEEGHTQKRGHPPNAWQSHKRKHQRTQQRAFTTRSDNPFASFQHDPNQAESFLDGLSQQIRRPSNEIIPPSELRKFDQRVGQTGRHATHDQPQTFRSKDRRIRRSMRVGSQRLTNHEILHMKADEAGVHSGTFLPSSMSTRSSVIGSISARGNDVREGFQGGNDHSLVYAYHPAHINSNTVYCPPQQALHYRVDPGQQYTNGPGSLYTDAMSGYNDTGHHGSENTGMNIDEGSNDYSREFIWNEGRSEFDSWYSVENPRVVSQFTFDDTARGTSQESSRDPWCESYINESLPYSPYNSQAGEFSRSF